MVTPKQKLLAAGAVIAAGLGLALLFPRRPTSKATPLAAADAPAAQRVAATLAPAAALDGQLSPAPPVVAVMTSLSADGGSPAADAAGVAPVVSPAPLIDAAASPAAVLPAGRPVYAPLEGFVDEAAPAPTEHRIHVVHNGDTLERLAERYLGEGARSLEIFDFNRDVLENPHLLPIGAELRIP